MSGEAAGGSSQASETLLLKTSREWYECGLQAMGQQNYIQAEESLKKALNCPDCADSSLVLAELSNLKRQSGELLASLQYGIDCIVQDGTITEASRTSLENIYGALKQLHQQDLSRVSTNCGGTMWTWGERTYLLTADPLDDQPSSQREKGTTLLDQAMEKANRQEDSYIILESGTYLCTSGHITAPGLRIICPFDKKAVITSEAYTTCTLVSHAKRTWLHGLKIVSSARGGSLEVQAGAEATACASNFLCSVAAPGPAVDVFLRGRLALMKCQVQGCREGTGVGISVRKAGFASLEECFIAFNKQGLLANSGAKVHAHSCSFRENSVVGLCATNRAEAQCVECQFSCNSNAGAMLTDTVRGCMLTDCDFFSNSLGIEIGQKGDTNQSPTDCGLVLVEGCRVHHNHKTGIRIYGSIVRAVVHGCRIFCNETFGIEVNNASAVGIEDNEILCNISVGALLITFATLVFVKNTLHHCRGRPVYIEEEEEDSVVSTLPEAPGVVPGTVERGYLHSRVTLDVQPFQLDNIFFCNAVNAKYEVAEGAQRCSMCFQAKALEEFKCERCGQGTYCSAACRRAYQPWHVQQCWLTFTNYMAILKRAGFLGQRSCFLAPPSQPAADGGAGATDYGYFDMQKTTPWQQHSLSPECYASPFVGDGYCFMEMRADPDNPEAHIQIESMGHHMQGVISSSMLRTHVLLTADHLSEDQQLCVLYCRAMLNAATQMLTLFADQHPSEEDIVKYRSLQAASAAARLLMALSGPQGQQPKPRRPKHHSPKRHQPTLQAISEQVEAHPATAEGSGDGWIPGVPVRESEPSSRAQEQDD